MMECIEARLEQKPNEELEWWTLANHILVHTLQGEKHFKRADKFIPETGDLSCSIVGPYGCAYGTLGVVLKPTTPKFFGEVDIDSFPLRDGTRIAYPGTSLPSDTSMAELMLATMLRGKYNEVIVDATKTKIIGVYVPKTGPDPSWCWNWLENELLDYARKNKLPKYHKRNIAELDKYYWNKSYLLAKKYGNSIKEVKEACKNGIPAELKELLDGKLNVSF